MLQATSGRMLWTFASTGAISTSSASPVFCAGRRRPCTRAAACPHSAGAAPPPRPRSAPQAVKGRRRLERRIQAVTKNGDGMTKQLLNMLTWTVCRGSPVQGPLGVHLGMAQLQEAPLPLCRYPEAQPERQGPCCQTAKSSLDLIRQSVAATY